MKISLPIAISLGASLLMATGLGLAFLQGHLRGSDPTASNTLRIAPPAGQQQRDDWPAEEVFRRAFWRNPGPDDRIEHAIRVEWSGADGVSRWAWYLEVEPSAELLQALRDPATFGVLPTESPRSWLPGDMPAPEWFPSRVEAKGVEVHQHPTQSLTLIYRAKDHRLFATDHGQGFAPPLVGAILLPIRASR